MNALTNEYRTVSYLLVCPLTVVTQCYIQRGGTEGARPHWEVQNAKWFIFSNVSNAVWLTGPGKSSGQPTQALFSHYQK